MPKTMKKWQQNNKKTRMHTRKGEIVTSNKDAVQKTS